ncbi:hypothetical protein M0R45_033625 [Rubus argutus]|uniref:Uncharacterized protein n=1 Tax=Rubus argutus TaxID=59490 RepID=A0AAW1WKT9_RUBAR
MIEEQAAEFAKNTQEQREELDLTKLALDHYMSELVGSSSYEADSTSSPTPGSMFPANTMSAIPPSGMEDID